MSYESERVSSEMTEKIWRVSDQWTESREMELADDDQRIGAPRMVTLLMVILLVIGDIRMVTGLDFMTHVEERLMAAQDTEVQRDTIKEMEQVFAYGEKSSFR